MQTRSALHAVAIGAATGLRTMAGPTALFSDGKMRSILPVLAAGELLVDKLPATPARTIPAGLIARVIAGAIVGAAVAGPADGNRAVYALLGVAGAVGAAYAGAAYRARATRYLPPFAAALVEDAVAYSLAASVARRVRSG